MIAIRSLLFNAVFFGWTTVMSVLAFLALLLGSRSQAVHGFARVWSHVVFALLRGLCGLDYRIRGLENLPEGPCILASKHQSAWDTMIFAHLVHNPCFVLKQELLQIPFFGWVIRRAGMVAVDRAGGTSALKRMVADARRRLAEGRSIVIFPEGTRVAPGAHRPYLPGVAALYAALGVPVVPIGLNSGLFWSRRSFLKRPGRILLELLPPIEPGLRRRDFMARLEAQVEGASNRLVAEAGAEPPATAEPSELKTNQER
jgi:1-acyl-sn-glycerol-3-phosphate acyltransferase